MFQEWKNLNLMIIAGNNFLGIEKIVKFCYTFTRWEILQIWNFLVDYFYYVGCKVKFIVEERWKRFFLSREQWGYFSQDKL